MQLNDVIYPSVCPPNTVNESTLNQLWITQTYRQSSGLTVGSNAVGQTTGK